MKYKLNTKKMTSHLGGPSAIVAAHKKLRKRCGFKPLSVVTIYSWHKTGSLRMNRLIELFSVADELGVTFGLKTFLEEDDGK